jgi:drug/metabolite transporter (DMT)-like permease
MPSLARDAKTKLLTVANLVLATACLVAIVALVIDYYSVVNSGQQYDIEVLNGPYLAVLVFLPGGALLSLAAAAHWWRWPARWLFQGLAIALLAVIVLLAHSL